MQTPPKVIVKWADACFSGFAYDIPKRRGVINETMGFLVEKTPTFLVLAKEFCHDNQGIRHIEEIPRYAVIECREVR